MKVSVSGAPAAAVNAWAKPIIAKTITTASFDVVAADLTGVTGNVEVEVRIPSNHNTMHSCTYIQTTRIMKPSFAPPPPSPLSFSTLQALFCPLSGGCNNFAPYSAHHNKTTNTKAGKLGDCFEDGDELALRSIKMFPNQKPRVGK